MTKTPEPKTEAQNKMQKPVGVKTRRFYFPTANNGDGASIEATSQEEALKILEAQSTNS